MPRSGPNPEDLDFEIHVDPSCLSTPAHEAAEHEVMDDDLPTKPEGDKVAERDDDMDGVKDETSAAADAAKAGADEKEDTAAADATEAVAEKNDEATASDATPEPSAEAGPEKQHESKPEETESVSDITNSSGEDTAAEVANTAIDTADEEKQSSDKTINDATKDAPAQEDSKSEKDFSEETPELAAAESAKAEEPEPEPLSEPSAEVAPVAEAEKEEPVQVESEPQAEDQPEEVMEEQSTPEEPEPPLEDVEPKEPFHADAELEPEAGPEVEVERETTPEPEVEAEAKADEVERGRSLQPAAEITTSDLAKEVEEALAMGVDLDETPTPAPLADSKDAHDDSPIEVQEASRSSSSLRRASGRTEALIQAAAKEVLERLEAQTMETIRNRSHSRQDSSGSTNLGTELHYDTRSEGTRRESYATESRASRRESYNTESRSSRRESYNTRPQSSRRESDILPTPLHTEDGADSSSQHGDSDVFSDRSPRSSLGSFDGHVDHHHKDPSNRSSKRSSRMSDVSVSEMSYYDKEEFVPTIRASNRMPFRSPSDVRALQYSSPAPSVTGSFSPRSSAKRPSMPTSSRLGSPTVSAQYTTKGRKTPTRFSPKKEPAPLVLLHVTLLPLRWQWAEVLEQASSDTLSPEAKTLREAWHHLHDRVAATVCERGILLSHPQDDYEVLEERLLEALDLPLRRRARVLECGHYIGPSNEMTLGEDTDSDEEYEEASRRKSALVKTHWCQTCRHDIRCESLGPGKIFRIKVYASNGLMRTGAWAACWKEMERVDVELEPIVESAVLDELERLAISQSQQLQLVKHDPTILESTEGRDSPGERAMSDFDRTMPSMDRDMHSLDRGIPALEEPPRESSHLEENNLLEPSYADHDVHAPVSPPHPTMEDFRSPSPEAMPRYDESEERRLRDEERMREIYGHPPPEPQHHEPAPEPHPEPRHGSFSAQSPPPPPQQQPEPQAQSQQHFHPEQQQTHQPPQPHSQEAYPPHHERQQAFQNAGLGELLLEAARVFMQDKKNLAIVVMSLLVLFMAIRPTPREVRDWDGQFVEHVAPGVYEAPVSSPLMETVQSVVESVTSSETPVQVIVQPTPQVEVPEVETVEVEAPEPSQEIPVSEPIAPTSSAAPVESSSSLVSEEVFAVEEESSLPSPSPSPSSSEEVKAPAPTAVHETITTRELVRIIETVTETVKAIVTETEVVKIQATPSVAPEPLDEEQVAQEDDKTREDGAEDQTDKVNVVQTEEDTSKTEEAPAPEATLLAGEPLTDATAEGAPATETAFPVEEEPAHGQDSDDKEPVDEKESAEQAEFMDDDHDEL
ncbi:hypothetical protein CH35J_007595 [Colletotrichum higginsianum]|uniref:Pathway-specific nitrogen regulator n=1 Tax=Colletotrichum higginsianum TaxID=80884 RepID=A0A4T0VWT0_9PEZI|nr:hypothetical protein CH35J_007595 [Colletotrichum higginsianum]